MFFVIMEKARFRRRRVVLQAQAEISFPETVMFLRDRNDNKCNLILIDDELE
jgi:hypothetical protein